MIFLRDQAISNAEQAAFARRFGELEVHPFLPARDDAPEVIVFENAASDYWPKRRVMERVTIIGDRPI